MSHHEPHPEMPENLHMVGVEQQEMGWYLNAVVTFGCLGSPNVKRSSLLDVCAS